MLDLIKSIFIVILGFVLLVKGSDYFVEGASNIASFFRIPQIIIGLTIVAMGTSVPEAAVSITAAYDGNAGIAIGNVVGSNILNILIILGVSSVIANIAIGTSMIKREIPYMIFVSLLLTIVGIDGKVSFQDGIVLMVFFALYLFYLFSTAKNSRSEIVKEIHGNIIIQILFVLGGIVAVIFGSDFVVDGATEVARYVGISERFIGLTIVALGTSLPELFTSVSAARKGNADIAVGNIVGSNIFNILFVIGATAIISEIPFATAFMIDSLVMVFTAIVLFYFACKEKKLVRKTGIIMLTLYALYFTYLCVVI